jgi:sortase A
VTSVLLLAFLTVPIGRPPAQTFDAVAQRLTAAQAERGAPTGTAGQPAVQLVPVTAAAEGFLPLGRVEIPKIGVVMPINAGVHEEVLDTGVGRWPGLGEDNIVLSGHRTTYLAPFADLDLLAPADQVNLVYGEGVAQTYEVFDTRVVPEAEYVDYVLGGTPEPDDRIVTLFACHPKGERTHRIVVRARAVAEQGGI